MAWYTLFHLLGQGEWIREGGGGTRPNPITTTITHGEQTNQAQDG